MRRPSSDRPFVVPRGTRFDFSNEPGRIERIPPPLDRFSWPRIATVLVIVGFWLIVIYLLGSGCFHPMPAHPAIAR